MTPTEHKLDTRPAVPPQLGKGCRLRNGKLTGDARRTNDAALPFMAKVGYRTRAWPADGWYARFSGPHPLDVVEVLNDEPEIKLAKDE